MDELRKKIENILNAPEVVMDGDKLDLAATQDKDIDQIMPLIASYSRKAEINILIKVYMDICDEIDEGVPEELAYRTVILQTKQNLQNLKEVKPEGKPNE